MAIACQWGGGGGGGGGGGVLKSDMNRDLLDDYLNLFQT